MAKKGRKKRDDDGGAGGSAELPEDYTIAESMASSFTNFDDFDDFSDEGGEDDDYLVGRKGKTDQTEAAAEGRFSKLQDALVSISEYSSEKRSARREATLRILFKALTQYATGELGFDAVHDASTDIRKACWTGLRTGAPPEQYAACRVIEATSVVLGADQDEWYESLPRDCTRVIQGNHQPCAVRVAAMRALSMACFINASDTEPGEDLMTLCEEVAQEEYRGNPVPDLLRAAAVECWSLLATTLADFYLAGQDDVTMGRGLAVLPLLQGCLESTVLELRSAAGEAICLIHEARIALGVVDEEAENATAKRYAEGSWEGTEWEEIMDEIQALVASLATESGKHISKRTKKLQRATFREFAAALDNEPPDETLLFRGGSLTLTTWKDIVSLGFIRHCLQGGFQIQLLTNPTLQAILGASSSLGQGVGLSQLEKRLFVSKTSEAAKGADMERAKQRTKRRNIQNHFLTVDDA